MLALGLLALFLPPIPSLFTFSTPVHSTAHAKAAPKRPFGYWLVGVNGEVYNFGASDLGSSTALPPEFAIVGSTATPNGRGYWLVGRNGAVFSFGDARYFGGLGQRPLAKPIVGIAATPDGRGYWLVGRDGGVFSFGDARYFGSLARRWIAQPVVGMAAAPNGRGYSLVGRDGAVYTFGSARYRGSLGRSHLTAPVVGMTSTRDGRGYWLVQTDGGVHSFGSARSLGSAAGRALNAPVVAMAATPDGLGYWLATGDGGVFAFGDAEFNGASATEPGSAPVVAIAPTAVGHEVAPPRLGQDISAYQCPPSGQIPRNRDTVAIVQVSGGSLNGPANPCYAAEARWAGSNLGAYIFLDGLPNPAPPEALVGPGGNCHGVVRCESFNFGWAWAQHWIALARAQGPDPGQWWLDVEAPWMWRSDPVSNGLVIKAAIKAIGAATGRAPGIYSTAYQWAQIAGGYMLPGVPLWVPGAGNLRGPGNTAAQYCASSASGFGGGVVSLVQYEYQGAFQGAYAGPQSSFDQDYACANWRVPSVHTAPQVHVVPSPVRRPHPSAVKPKPHPKGTPVKAHHPPAKAHQPPKKK